MSRLLLCAGQVQIIQVKLDQGQLQHPAALGSFVQEKSLTSGDWEAVGVQTKWEFEECLSQ